MQKLITIALVASILVGSCVYQNIELEKIKAEKEIMVAKHTQEIAKHRQELILLQELEFTKIMKMLASSSEEATPPSPPGSSKKDIESDRP